ncbi:nuclear transport factor 2 family protein [Saccharomonospora sp. NPDC046836]|uniref:nuclear transport factor 2 family protein n=1 Tax=Saccharomonospora sp. NPDC046836 TaxID=3156921 RepID=UPI0033F6337B
MQYEGPLNPLVRLEIGELYARYAKYYDDGQGEKFGALFTSAATFVRGPGTDPVVGRDEIVELARSAGTPGIRHFVSNVVVDPAPGKTATGSAYVQVVTADEEAVRLVTMGCYTDEFRYEDGSWRFHLHRYDPFTGAGLRGAVLATIC